MATKVVNHLPAFVSKTQLRTARRMTQALVLGASEASAMTPIDTTGASQGAWYRVISATATLSPTVSHTGGDWDAALVGFRLAP